MRAQKTGGNWLRLPEVPLSKFKKILSILVKYTVGHYYCVEMEHSRSESPFDVLERMWERWWEFFAYRNSTNFHLTIEMLLVKLHYKIMSVFPLKSVKNLPFIERAVPFHFTPKRQLIFWSFNWKQKRWNANKGLSFCPKYFQLKAPSIWFLTEKKSRYDNKLAASSFFQVRSWEENVHARESSVTQTP